MAIVKQVSFKEKERELFEYANNHGNFSEYIKRLIQAELNMSLIKPITGIPQGMVVPLNTSENVGAPGEVTYVLEAKREELDL